MNKKENSNSVVYKSATSLRKIAAHAHNFLPHERKCVVRKLFEVYAGSIMLKIMQVNHNMWVLCLKKSNSLAFDQKTFQIVKSFYERDYVN